MEGRQIKEKTHKKDPEKDGQEILKMAWQNYRMATSRLE